MSLIWFVIDGKVLPSAKMYTDEEKWKMREDGLEFFMDKSSAEWFASYGRE